MKIRKISIARMLLVLMLLVSITVFATSCGDDTATDDTATDDSTTEETSIDDISATEDTELPEVIDTSVEEDEAVAKTPLDIVQAMADECSGTDAAEEDAAVVGADLGASFMVGENKFEVYQFSDEAKIIEAQGGKMQFAPEGSEAYEMLASVNGNFVMLYTTADDAVIAAFGNQ